MSAPSTTPLAVARTLAECRERIAAVASSRAAAIVARAPAAAERLRAEFGARRVWLFGSLVAGTPHESSDADLAVEGLSSMRVDAAAAAMEVMLGCAVDLVQIELASPSLLERVGREGKEL